MLGQLQRAYLRNGRVLWVRALHLSLQLNHGPFQHRTVCAAYRQQHAVLACDHGAPCRSSRSTCPHNLNFCFCFGAFLAHRSVHEAVKFSIRWLQQPVNMLQNRPCYMLHRSRAGRQQVSTWASQKARQNHASGIVLAEGQLRQRLLFTQRLMHTFFISCSAQHSVHRCMTRLRGEQEPPQMDFSASKKFWQL